MISFPDGKQHPLDWSTRGRRCYLIYDQSLNSPPDGSSGKFSATRSEQIPQRPQDANSPRAVSSQILRGEAAASGYLPISQLGQIVDDDDATCDGPNRGVYQYVEVKEHRMLLSQRCEMPQLPLSGDNTRTLIRPIEGLEKDLYQPLSFFRVHKPSVGCFVPFPQLHPYCP